MDDLKIPEETEEDRALWEDPLRAGEVKPLRRDDYLRLGTSWLCRALDERKLMLVCVAKSQPLRQILAPPDPSLPAYAHPQTHLRQLLTAIAGIKNLKEREQVLARCLGLDEGGSGPRVGGQGKGGKRGGKTQSQARGEGFYIPDPVQHATTEPEDAKLADAKPTETNAPTTTPSSSKDAKPPPTASKGLYIGAQEQATMREFTELVQRVLERDGDQEEEGRGVKRKVEWGV